MKSDIQVKIEELLKPLTKVSKSWQENLSKHIDGFMSCIAELSDDEEVGLTATNFVQAGILIESASRIYAVNVDIVWECMNEVLEQMRMNKNSNSNSRTESESSENPEEVRRKRRRKVLCDNFEEFVPRVIDPDLRSDERNQIIKPLPMSRCLMGKSDWKRRKRPYQVFDMEYDTLDPSEYGVMYQTSVFGKLQSNMLKEMVEDSSNGERSIRELIYTLELLHKELSLTVIDSCSEYSSSSIDDRSLTPSVEEIIGSPTRVTMLVTPPPSPLTVKRSNSASIEAPSAIKRSMSDADSEKEVCAGGLTTKKEHLVTITAGTWASDQLESSMNEKNLQKRPTLALTPNIKPLKPEEQGEVEERKRRPSGGVKIVIQYVDMNMFYVFHKNRNSCGSIIRRFYIQENKKKKMVLKEHSRITFSIKSKPSVIHTSLSQNITADFAGFEDFEADPGEEDGFCGFPVNEDEQNLSTQSCTCVVSSDSNNVVSSEECHICPNNVNSVNVGDSEIPSTGIDSIGNDNVNNSENCCEGAPVAPDTIEGLPCTDNEEPHCTENEEPSGNSEVPVERLNLESQESCQQMLERVTEWERLIRPKLKQAHERGHFDIHGIGSQILKSFPDSDSGATLDFRQFLVDKPQVDVARYFLATLQLANSYNVEIHQSVPGDLAMDCMQLKLISSVRHHESLEDYEAPSEGARRNRKRQHVQEMSSDSDGDPDSDSEVDYRSKQKYSKR